MKKVVRTVWISLLTGLAFLVACTTPKGLTRAEKKQLKAERESYVEILEQHATLSSDDPKEMLNIKDEEMFLVQKIYDIDLRLGKKQDILYEDAEKLKKVSNELDSIRKVIADMETEIPPCVYGPPADDPYIINEKEQTRIELTERLETLLQTIRRREGACVYGSPEVIQKYGEETRRLKAEAAEIQKQLDELDNEKQ